MAKIVKLSYQTTKYTYHDDWGDNSFYKYRYVVLGIDRSKYSYLPAWKFLTTNQLHVLNIILLRSLLLILKFVLD